MKRRDFLIKAGLVGAIAPQAARALIPCPPPKLSAGNGKSVTTPCTPLSAQQDWQARISAPGVVWYHNFDTVNELHAFLWSQASGSNPSASDNNNNGQTSLSVVGPGNDGPAGGLFPYLSDFRPSGNYQAGVSESSPDNNCVWWRPYSPMPAMTGTVLNNGKTVPDPAAGGSVTLRTWDPVGGGVGTMEDWAYGWYNRGDGLGISANQDGTDFYIQVRVKVDPRCSWGTISPSNPTGPGILANTGCKLIEHGIAHNTLTQQNLVTVLNGSGAYKTGATYAGTNFCIGYDDYNFNSWDYNSTTPNGNVGPNGAYQVQTGGDAYTAGNVCYLNIPTSYQYGWSYDYSGGWDTLLYHITPGPNTAPSNYLGLQIWAAHQGVTSYTKIYDEQISLPNGYDNTSVAGYQAFYLSTYCNGYAGVGQPSNILNKWAQIIFSKQPIACPQY